VGRGDALWLEWLQWLESPSEEPPPSKLSAADGGWGIMDGSDDQSIQTLRPSPSCTDARLQQDGTERYSPAQDSVKNRECEHSLVLHAIAACYIATAHISRIKETQRPSPAQQDHHPYHTWVRSNKGQSSLLPGIPSALLGLLQRHTNAKYCSTLSRFLGLRFSEAH
jgi:hypothetical protein